MTSIRKAERRDLPSLGKLGALLMRTHYAFDPQRFLAAGEGAERGYASFLGSMLDADDAVIFVAEQDGAIAGYHWNAVERSGLLRAQEPEDPNVRGKRDASSFAHRRAADRAAHLAPVAVPVSRA